MVTATHMQLIGYSMLDVSHIRALQLSSRQHYIAQTGPFYIAFRRFTTQPIKFKRFVKVCYAVIANIYSSSMYFQRFISNKWCSKSKQITVLSKGKAFNFYELIACFGMTIL